MENLFQFYSNYVVSLQTLEQIELGCRQLFTNHDLGPEAIISAKKIFTTLNGNILNPVFTKMLTETTSTFTSSYQYNEEIAQGGESEVGTYNLNDEVIVLKIQEFKNAIKELTYLKYIGSHPFILNIINFVIGIGDVYGLIGNDVGVVDQRDVIYIFMPLYKDLSKAIYGDNDPDEINLMNLLSETNKHKYMHQILVAIDYIHSKNIIHMDIKPQNILIDKYDNIKLIDFDHSVYGIERKLRKTKGTQKYSPPEFIGKNSTEFSLEVDVYTTGITFIEIVRGSYSRQADGCGRYTDLINWMISDASSRPTIKNCIAVLNSL